MLADRDPVSDLARQVSLTLLNQTASTGANNMVLVYPTPPPPPRPGSQASAVSRNSLPPVVSFLPTPPPPLSLVAAAALVALVASPPSNAFSGYQVCVICFDEHLAEHDDACICPQHYVCPQCSEQYAHTELLFLAKHDLKCPLPECKHVVGSDDVYLHLLGLDEYEKFKPRRNKTTAGFTCPKCDRVMVIGAYNYAFKTRTEACCDMCGLRMCLYCRERVCDADDDGAHMAAAGGEDSAWWFSSLRAPTRHVCANDSARRLARLVQNPRNNIKPCPECFTLLHRFEGCTHMTCAGPAGCRAEFCWLCLTPKILSHVCLAEPHASAVSRLRSNVSRGLSRSVELVARTAQSVRRAPFKMYIVVHSAAARGSA